MRSLIATILIGAALTGTATYEAYHPQGAAWFHEGKFVPDQPEYAPSSTNEDGIIRKHTNQGSMEAPKYENEVYADFRATGPPQLDNYPKSPEEAALKESRASAKEVGNIANYGVYFKPK